MNLRWFVSFVIVTTVSVLQFSCSYQMKAYSDHDPAYRVESYKTFHWQIKPVNESEKNPLEYNELNDKRIKSAINRELTKRRYVQSADARDAATLEVHYHIVIADQTSKRVYPDDDAFGSYWVDAPVFNYKEGTLIVDLMDPTNKNLVWRGWVTAPLDDVRPEDTESMINTAVTKIFRRLPNAN